MRTWLSAVVGVIVFAAMQSLIAQGSSQGIKDELNSKTPDWLNIGEPIRVAPAGDMPVNQATSRPISGDSRSTRDRVIIPGRGIEIKVDYPISWYRGSSLSPDGTKLIINSGIESKAYEIFANGSYRAIELQLPRVTYDDGPKGFISGWSWADNETLLGEAEINNERGEFIEKRIYVFHLKQKTLSRLDLSALNLPSLEGLTVTKVGKDLNQLQISIGGKEFTAKADLRLPPSIDSSETKAPQPKSLPTSKEEAVSASPSPTPASPIKAERSAPKEDAPTNSAWMYALAVIILAGLGFVVYRSRR